MTVLSLTQRAAMFLRVNQLHDRLSWTPPERTLLCFRAEVSMRRQPLSVVLCFFSLVWTAACGAHNPESPSPVNGAAVSGTIVAPGSSTPASGGMGVGLTVSVVGTAVAATVSSANQFTLANVPAGDLTLRFSGNGFSGDLPISGVATTEQIAVAVSLAQTSGVTLESERRSSAGQEQLEGRVEALPPVVAANAVTVAGVVVQTTATTQFFLNGGAGTYADLIVGVRVHVKGHRDGTSLVADVVEIQNTNADLPVEINGVVKNLTGPQSGFQFTVNDRTIKGDAATEFFGGSVFADLANDARVEVKGAERNGFVYAARIHVNDDGEDDPPQDTSASIEGTLTASTGGAAPTLTVAGTTVHTSASTVVQRRGDVQTLAVLQIGMTLHVVGDRQADSSIDARLIQIKDDAVGATFEITGAVGGLKGTCPAISFGVNGYSVVADASTTFTTACSSLKSGNQVLVKGTVQAGGTVKATTITKQ